LKKLTNRKKKKTGLETHKVPMALYRQNRERLVARLEKSAGAASALAGGVVLLRGGRAKTRHETDHEHLFRQESFFHWTFGVAEPDCFGAIDLASRRSILFIPRLPAEYAIWMGKVDSPHVHAACRCARALVSRLCVCVC
jgi:Xaa-Pro dipeptidase